jgi:hypothetical protein
MTSVPDPVGLYEAKALAELRDADALARVGDGGWGGDVLGTVALVVGAAHGAKGSLLPADAAEAVDKALVALGFGSGSAFVIASRPAGADPAALAARLRLALEAVDSPLVLALDGDGLQDLAAAFGLTALEAGQPVRSAGRVLGGVGDFAGSLGDPKAKARVWAAMKAAAAAAGHKTQARRP